MKIKHFFDFDTATFSYIISDCKTNKCAIIDPVLNYDQFSGATSTKSADEIISYIKEYNLEVEWILETHVHADHLTSSQYLKDNLGGKVAIGENIIEVAKFWSPIFNNEIKIDGSYFDILLQDKQIITIGNMTTKIIYTPGHTPACCCYFVGDAIFVGDTIFQPHVGTARTDFPGGSAQDLYISIQKILSLPDATNIYVGHDYPEDKATPISTVKEQKEKNIMIAKNVNQDDFIKARNKKDENKSVPKLLLPSIQFNLRAGSFGNKEVNGINYIKIPINKIG